MCFLNESIGIMNVPILKMLPLCRHQNSDSGGWNGSTETKKDAKAKTRDHYCHSRTSVGLDPGEASTSAEPQTAQVSHNLHLPFSYMIGQYVKKSILQYEK